MANHLDKIIKTYAQRLSLKPFSLVVKYINELSLIAFLVLVLPSCSFAQSKMSSERVERDLSVLSCSDITRISDKGRGTMVGLLHGYYMGKNNSTVFDSSLISDSSRKVVDYCRGHQNEKVLPLIGRLQNKMLAGKQDLNVLSCQQFVKLDLTDQNIMVGLLNGYYLGNDGATSFDPTRVVETSNQMTKYCQSHLEDKTLKLVGKLYKGKPQQVAPEAKSLPADAPAVSLGQHNAQDSPNGIRAFPTAVGYGSKSVGGRGGKIIYVTTLEDNWDPGSLRYALQKETGPRVIIFRVAGIIELKEPGRGSFKDININNPYVTIAGQTAPGDGICIKNGGIAVNTHDVIIRHLCIRPGDDRDGTKPEDRDAIKIQKGYNIILDHISASWSIDENISTWATKGSPPPQDITVQNSIIAEGLYKSLHPKVHHSRGLLVGDHCKNVTIFQNVFAHNNRRNPQVKGDTSNIDVVNNVIYNWGDYKGFGTNFSDRESSGPTHTNIINNYYFKGPNSGNNFFYFDRMSQGSRILVTGNSGDISEQVYRDKAKYPFVLDGAFKNNNLSNSNIKSPIDSILENAGAFIPVRDDVDKRIINEVKTKTGKIINAVSEVGGYPKIKSGAPYQDSDKDGISDDWELKHKMNPNDASDSRKDSDNDGYTNIEEFLNELAGDK